MTSPRWILPIITFAVLIAPIDVTIAEAHTATPATSTYTVRAGDGLASIALALGVRLSDLLALNHLTTRSTIHAGQVLRVPAASAKPPSPSSTLAPPQAAGTAQTTSTYTVRAGDTLSDIARRHAVTLRLLLDANNFTAASLLVPGQVIRIPTAAPTSATATATATTTTVIPEPPKPSQTTASATTMVAYLRQQVGKPYKFFTAGPDTFDCSGLVVAAYRQIGITLPHQSRMQSTIGTAVDLRSEPIQAGDLIFMVSSVDPTRIGHVGIALGDGTWIKAVATGIPVRIRALPTADKISAVRRILGT